MRFTVYPEGEEVLANFLFEYDLRYRAVLTARVAQFDGTNTMPFTLTEQAFRLHKWINLENLLAFTPNTREMFLLQLLAFKDAMLDPTDTSTETIELARRLHRLELNRRGIP